MVDSSDKKGVIVWGDNTLKSDSDGHREIINDVIRKFLIDQWSRGLIAGDSI